MPLSISYALLYTYTIATNHVEANTVYSVHTGVIARSLIWTTHTDHIQYANG